MLFFPLENHLGIAANLLLMVCIVYHLKILCPFTPWYPKEIGDSKSEGDSLQILTVNVRQKNDQYDELIKLQKEVRPDVILLTEVDNLWVKHIDAFEQIYPYSILVPQDNTFGMALYSQYPFENPRINFLLQKDVPSIHTNINFKGKVIQFLGLHPRPPAPSNRSELKEIELIKAADITNYNSLPSIVGGDLNDVGWSKTIQKFKRISGLLDPRIGRGFLNTYNALIPIGRVPLDHFMLSKHFKIRKIKRLHKIGSDHFPLLLEVDL